MSKLFIVVTGLFLVCSVQKRVTLHPLSRYSHAVTYYPRPLRELIILVITGKHQELAVFDVHGPRPPGSVHTFNTSVWYFPVITAPSVNTIIKQLQWNNCALALVTDNLKSLMHVIIFYFYSTASVGTRVNFKVYLRMTLKAEQLTTEQLKNVILGNVMKKSISSGEYTEKSYLKPDEVYVVGRKSATSEVGVNIAIGK